MILCTTDGGLSVCKSVCDFEYGCKCHFCASRENVSDIRAWEGSYRPSKGMVPPLSTSLLSLFPSFEILEVLTDQLAALTLFQKSQYRKLRFHVSPQIRRSRRFCLLWHCRKAAAAAALSGSSRIYPSARVACLFVSLMALMFIVTQCTLLVLNLGSKVAIDNHLPSCPTHRNSRP